MKGSIFKSEVKAIVTHWPIWVMLGMQDIKIRYRRSTLGPFWITLSMAVTIYSMGFLYGHLFKIPLQHYFPYLASGIIMWGFISTIIMDSSNTFIESEPFIRNQESYMSSFIMRMLLRNIIILLHNIVVFIPIPFLFPVGFSWHILLIIPGMLIICVNGFIWGGILAIVGTRYRDCAQLVNSLIQVVFFVTPIMWMPKLLPGHMHWAIAFNPFNQILNLARYPLLNYSIGINTWIYTGLITLFGIMLFYYFINKCKYRIVFWL